MRFTLDSPSATLKPLLDYGIALHDHIEKFLPIQGRPETAYRAPRSPTNNIAFHMTCDSAAALEKYMRSIDSPWVPHNGPGGTFQGQLTAEMHVQSGNCTWKQNLCALQARDTAIPILEWFTLHPFNTDTTAPVPTFPFQLLDQFRNALIGLRDEHDLASRQQTTSDGKPAKNGDAPALPLEAKEGTAAAAPPKSRAWCHTTPPSVRAPGGSSFDLGPITGNQKEVEAALEMQWRTAEKRQDRAFYIQEIKKGEYAVYFQHQAQLANASQRLEDFRTRANAQQQAATCNPSKKKRPK